jgi:hypothetical protein
MRKQHEDTMYEPENRPVPDMETATNLILEFLTPQKHEKCISVVYILSSLLHFVTMVCLSGQIVLLNLEILSYHLFKYLF